MNLSLSSAWASDIFARTEGLNHLVLTIRATDQAPKHRLPIDIAFALDRSGSMSPPDKIEVVKDAVITALDCLRPTDRVALVTFDNEVVVEHRLTPLDAPHRARLERVTRRIQPRGTTNLHGGWWEACSQLAAGESGERRIRRSMLLTDGQANVGLTHPAQLAQHATELRERGIGTSAIGVGFQFDELLLSAMAEAGGGNFEFIAHARELEAFFSHELNSLTATVATDPFLDITLPAGLNAELINAFPHRAHPHGLSIDLRDLAAGEELKLVIEVTSRFIRDQERNITPQVHLHWTNPDTGATEEVDEAGASIAIGDPALAKRDDAASEAVAFELSDRDKREAVRLDREGRYQDARRRSADAYARMQAMPATAAVLDERRNLQAMMDVDPSAPMSEAMRKSQVHRSHARSRGRAR